MSCGLLQPLCGLLPPPCDLCSLYVGYHIHYLGYSSSVCAVDASTWEVDTTAWANSASMWAFVSSMWDVAVTMWAENPLPRLFQNLRGKLLLQGGLHLLCVGCFSLCACILCRNVGCCSLDVGSYRDCVG